jgi:hypothetical protein
MNASLDVRHAIHEANRVFCRYPVRICLPMILFGVVSCAVTPFLTPGIHLYWLYILIDGLGTFWLVSLVEVVVASMCLRALEGTEPGAAQVSEALHYRGFGALIWGLIFRYIGWTLLLSLIIGVISAFAAILSLGIHAAVAPANGISAFAGGFHLVGIIIVAIVGAVVFALVLSRYIFVLPMFAIARTSGPGFLNQCVRRTTHVWKTASLVLVAGTAPAFALSGIEFLAWKSLTPPHGIHLAFQLAGTFFIDCYAAWFILLKTGLAVQLMSLPLPVSPEPPPQLADVGPPPL